MEVEWEWEEEERWKEALWALEEEEGREGKDQEEVTGVEEGGKGSGTKEGEDSEA